MPRKPRIQYAGAVYHVMCRGNGGQEIYKDDSDRQIFLETLGEACGRCGWKIHAYVLMGNHYHFLLETPESNLVTGMKWFQGTYTQRYNARHRRWGHLFQGRYKALLIHAEETKYWNTVSSYIHLNPVRAGMIHPQTGSLADYSWSSYPHYVRTGNRPSWLCVERVLDSKGYADTPEGRKAYRQFMTKRTVEIQHAGNPLEIENEWKSIRRGWFLGSDAFKDKLDVLIDRQIGEKKRTSYSGEQVVEHDERMAEQLIQAGLRALKLEEEEVQAGKKSSNEKCLLAWLIRRRTSVSNAWISQRLNMGRPDCMSRYPRRIDETTDKQLKKQKKLLDKIL